MFYVALFLLVLLGLISLAVVVLNMGTLLSSVNLDLYIGHLSIPVFLLCLLGACLGGVLLYVVSVLAARRDMKEIGNLRARVEELEQVQVRSSSNGSLITNFAPPVVPVPGFSSEQNFFGSGGEQHQFRRDSQTGPLVPGQSLSSPQLSRQPSSSSSLLNLSPSSSGISNLQLPTKQSTPPQSSSSGAPRPPFFSQ